MIFKISANLRSLIHAAAPVLTKILFTLFFIKLISSNGQVGSLANWGNVQNTVGLAAVILGLSVQSGIASNTASRKDDHALVRALIIVGVMVGIAGLGVLFAELMDFDTGFILPSYAVVLGGGSAAIFNYLTSFLPVRNKFALLLVMNFLFGSLVSIFLFYKGSYNVDDQAFSLSLGYFFTVAFLLLMLRHTIFDGVNSAELRNLPKYLNLVTYGIASAANTVSVLLVLMTVRAEVFATGGGSSADTFEAAVRLVALLEGSVGIVIGMLVWRLVGSVGHLALNKQGAFVFVMFAIAGFFCLAMLGFGDVLTKFIFSPDYKFDGFMIILMSAYAALKLTSTVLIIPAFISGEIKFLLLVEAAYCSVGLLVFYWLISLHIFSIVENAFVGMIFGAFVVNLLLASKNIFNSKLVKTT